MIKKLLLLIICLSLPTTSWTLFGFNILGKADRDFLNHWHFKTAPITLDVTPRTIHTLKTMPLVLFGTCAGLYGLLKIKEGLQSLIDGKPSNTPHQQQTTALSKQELLTTIAGISLLIASITLIAKSDALIAWVQ